MIEPQIRNELQCLENYNILLKIFDPGIIFNL